MSYWCPIKHKRRHVPTPYRIDDPHGKRKALEYARVYSKNASVDKSVAKEERWENWVAGFLDDKYPKITRYKTWQRYTYAWSQWQQFLHEKQIRVPRALDYNVVLEFVKWRSSQVKPSSGKIVSKNTALCDVRCMSTVMREALRRNYHTFNPCEKLGIEKDRAKEKREMTDDEIAKIREALKTRPDWMRISFEIAIHQGCRLSETALNWSDVDLDRRTITFRGKGRNGAPHIFTTALHPHLKEFFLTLRTTGVTENSPIVILPSMAAKEFHYFFRTIGLRWLCFHCTRVTVVTRLARAGVPIRQAMAYVGHSSEIVNKLYTKLSAPDLSGAVAALKV